jgi:F-type H+-transporting ATPase subunit b
MIRRLTTAAFILLPAIAMPGMALAESSTMPQMDFKNPLTTDQIFWMVIILVGLYLALQRWALPSVGAVLENRAAIIARDLAAARAAKTAADQAVAALNRELKSARATAQAEIAAAVAAAKAEALAKAAAMSAKLDAQLAESEAQINAARATAMAAIKPVAEETTATMLARLTGQTTEPATIADRVDAAIAARQAA